MAIEVGLSIPSQRVIRILERLIFEKGKPVNIRTNNGPEFTSHQLADFCQGRKIEQWFIQPGKPCQNEYIERFNRTYREDILDAYIFEGLESLRMLSKQWLEKYNQGHPHQALGGRSPLAFKDHRKETSKQFVYFKPV